MKYILFFFVFLFCNTLFTQSLSYTFPREKTNLYGPIEHMFRYEYPTHDSNDKSNAAVHDPFHLNMSFHFNKEGIQTHQVSYRKGKINKISSYLYNQDGNLSYIIEQNASQVPIKSREEVLEFIEKKMEYRIFSTDYQFLRSESSFAKNPLFFKANGAFIQKHEYDIQNRNILITSNKLEGSKYITLDKQNRVILFQQHIMNEGKVQLFTSEKIYEKDLLVEKIYTMKNGEKSTIKNTYDSLNRIVSERVEHSILGSTEKKYSYPSDSIQMITTYNTTGTIESQIYIITIETPSIKTVQHYDINNDIGKKLILEKVSFFDKYGNTIKIYSPKNIYGDSTMIEREYIYYK